VISIWVMYLHSAPSLPDS